MKCAKDIEMLMLAANAAGLDVRFDCDALDDGKYPCQIDADGGWSYSWNPLTDSGDALLLGICLELFNTAEVLAAINKFDPSIQDPYAAIRRAIVIGAAAKAKI